MQSVFEIKDYRQILRIEMTERQQRNPRYSLRAFARDLGMSPSMLSDLLNSKHGLSRNSARKIAAGLDLQAQEREYFCDLVESTEARSAAARTAAKARLVRYHSVSNFAQLSQDCFALIADWYHLAILGLFDLQGFSPEPRRIASMLRIEVSEATQALERLKRLGLVAENDGNWSSKLELYEVASDVPSRAIRQLHAQMMKNAIRAMNEQPREEREFGSVFLPMDSDDVERIKAKICDFQQELMVYVNRSSKKDQLAALNMQFFKICDLRVLN
jgi:uncharacterized protein (TIGR02147 family)